MLGEFKNKNTTPLNSSKKMSFLQPAVYQTGDKEYAISPYKSF